MTADQKRFADEYLIDLNAKQAAMRAGCEAGTAESTAWRFLGDPEVATYIRRQRVIWAARLEFLRERILAALAKIAFGSIADIIDFDQPIPSLRPDLNPIAMAAVALLTVEEVRNRRTGGVMACIRFD